MTSPVSFDRFSLVASVIMIVFLTVFMGSMAIYVLSDPAFGQAETLLNAASAIEAVYPGEVSPGSLMETAREEIFDRLDRYSGFVDRDGFATMDEELTGGYTGVGITVVEHDAGLMVITVRESGPAFEAGLRTGDIITAVDSIFIADMDTEDASHRIRGEEGSKVLLSISRPVSGDTFDVNVERRRIPLMHIPYAGITDDSLMYVRLVDFDHGASDDLEAAVDSLMHVDSIPLRGILLDLTNNPGGLFAEAYHVSNLFLDAGSFVVGTDARSRWNESRHVSSGRDITGGLPLAVLVNKGSASAAEIVAGALQQTGRAVLVGDTTFGKGLVQGFVRYPSGDGLRLTISRYFFEGPIYLNDFDTTLRDTGHGLVPDHYLPPEPISQFQRELVTQLILREFVLLHKDQLYGAARADSLDDSWIDQLAAFASDLDFTYRSRRTELWEDFLEMARELESSSEVRRLARKLTVVSDLDDRCRFQREAGQLKSRLRELVFETVEGVAGSYREVVVPTRPDIRVASSILLQERSL